MTEIILKNPAFLAAASLFASKDMTRYYLNGVLIEPDPQGGVFLVATDGHRMVVFRDPEGCTDAPHIVSLPKRLFDACKFHRSRKNPELVADSQYIHLYDNNKRVDVQIFLEIEGDYPDWRRVAPKNCLAFHPAQLTTKCLATFRRLLRTHMRLQGQSGFKNWPKWQRPSSYLSRKT